MWVADSQDDSQDDSQVSRRLRTNADGHGLRPFMTELARTLEDGYGRWTRGLQNRLRGAVEASWVGSIPIHPRPLSPNCQPKRRFALQSGCSRADRAYDRTVTHRARRDVWQAQ